MTLTKANLFTLLEYKVLSKKLRQYCLSTLIDNYTHTHACTVLALNPDRVRKDAKVKRCQDAWASLQTLTPAMKDALKIPKAKPLTGNWSEYPADVQKAALFECARRIEGRRYPEDPQFAATTFHRPDGSALLPDSEVPGDKD